MKASAYVAVAAIAAAAGVLVYRYAVMPPAASPSYQFGPTGQPINSLGPGFGPYGSGEFGPE